MTAFDSDTLLWPSLVDVSPPITEIFEGRSKIRRLVIARNETGLR
jgi:hypothetical protein